MSKVETVKELISEVEHLSNIILLSSRKVEIIKSFKRLMCLLRGECICDICKSWDKNVFIVFELGRCLVPSRFLQLVKERHATTKRWSYIQPLYKELYDTMNEDISPNEPIIHSSGDVEDQTCIYKLPDKLKLFLAGLGNTKGFIEFETCCNAVGNPAHGLHLSQQ